MSAKHTSTLIARILSDIRVEMADEFDLNFERQAFFNEAWQRRKSPVRAGKPLLIDKGLLRRSIKSRQTEHSVIFESTLPYAAIHNDGGTIRVTSRMKRFFWAKYYEQAGLLTRTKSGKVRAGARNARINELADFWLHMALMRVGSVIRIPRRRFLGTGSEVEKKVRSIVEDALTEYFDNDFEFNLRVQ